MALHRRPWHLGEHLKAWDREIRARYRAQKVAEQAAVEATEAEARRLVAAGAPAPRGSSSLLRGMVACLRGLKAEERIVRLLNEWPDRPTWLLGAVRAPEDIDQLGIDVVVYSADLGTLPLQVKSSPDAVEQFLRSHPDIAEIVGVVVAPAELPDEEAWARVMAALGRLRDRVQQEAFAEAG